jgi:rhodanese-related sulfurtransferase
MSIITPEKALKMTKDGALLVDVRTPAEYRSIHAKGALCFPLDKLQKNAEEITPVIKDHKQILLICKSGGRTKIAYDILAKQFGQTFFIVEGGTDAWAEKDLPLITGKGTISIERQVRICAGAIVLIGCLLALTVTKWFLLIPIIVGAGLVNAGITDWCGMGLFLAKMPWNK